MRWALFVLASCSAANGANTTALRSENESIALPTANRSGVVKIAPVTLTAKRDTEAELAVMGAIDEGVEIELISTDVYGAEKVARPKAGSTSTLHTRWSGIRSGPPRFGCSWKFIVPGTAPLGENRLKGAVRYRVCQTNMDRHHYVPVGECGPEETEMFDVIIIVSP